MRMFFTISFGLILVLLACDENAKFRGLGNASKNSKDVMGEKDATECTFDDEFVKLNFPEDIQKCIDQGNIYHFGDGATEGKCSKVRTSSFTCNFGELIAAIGKLGISTASIEKARSDGGKLVACGEKNSGRTVVVQWIFPQGEDANCNYKREDTAQIMTACFKLYKGSAPPAPTTAAERRAAVSACMDED